MKDHRTLLAEAEAEVVALDAHEVLALHGSEGVLIVDLRESEELLAKGRIPGSLHVPRGNLEFQVDPTSPFHVPALAEARRLILHCGGGWRSALAAQTLQRMGVPDVAHMRGGFKAWKEAGGPVEGAAPAPGPRVTGLGGLFFRCRDSQALNQWYRTHLGIPTEPYGYAFRWREMADPGSVGYTVWSPMAQDSAYFEPSEKPYMVNYRVADLEALLEALKAEGVTIVGAIQDEPNGRFGWILDPEGTKVELWQPVPSALDPYL